MVSKEEYEKLEKRVADLEKKVQDQLSIEEFKKTLEEVKEQMIIQVEELFKEEG